jgi:hypothetical protein
MKLTDFEIKKEKVEEAVLVEKLGTLAQLGIGPLINILKQHKGGRHGLTPVKSKFEPSYGYAQIGSESEIVDIGPIKNGLADIRKAYKTVGAEGNASIQAFALYISGQPISFAVFDRDALAGSTRTGKMAFDLSAFKPAIEQIDQERTAEIQAKAAWRQPATPTRITTAQDREERRYDSKKDTYDVKPHQYQGEVYTTSQLKEFLELADKIAKIVGKPLTAKAVLGDIKATAKRQKRYKNNEIESGANDLRTRLAIYKNTKKPTAETIEDFIAMSLKNPGKQARFAGQTYNLKSSTYEKIDPMELLKGKSFTVRYSCTDPGSYDSLELTYAYNPKNNQLLPVFAVWYDRTDPSNRSNRQEGVLDPVAYLRIKLGVADLENKDAVIKKLLEKFKVGQYHDVLVLIDSLKKSGADWPELDAVQKSATIEYEKKKKA